MKKTVFYDEIGNETTPEKAARAEITTYTPGGSVLMVEYYEVKPKSIDPVPPKVKPALPKQS
jgi:hypothetical protein